MQPLYSKELAKSVRLCLYGSLTCFNFVCSDGRVHQAQSSHPSHYPTAVKQDRLPMYALCVHHWSTRFSGFVKSVYYILTTSFAVIQERVPIRLCLCQLTTSLASNISGKGQGILFSNLNRCAGVWKRMNAGVAFREAQELWSTNIIMSISTHSNLPSMTHSLR